MNDHDDNEDEIEFGELTALIIDDDPITVDFIQTLLQSCGMKEIRHARDGSQAIKVIQSFAPSFIILDHMMEPMDGVEFSRWVRRDAQSLNQYVPIMMLTAMLDKVSILEARDAGVNEIVAKPISLDMLEKRLISMMKTHRKFVRSKAYVGPDRRRREKQRIEKSDRRRIDLTE
ncbi:MAG: response regulator [Rhodospirillaceae bacterium]|jgi:two-component system, chemotaxis family, chemotaxis protein CheY|nr:response regulator [Rhodospirillaceae bacterium]